MNNPFLTHQTRLVFLVACAALASACGKPPKLEVDAQLSPYLESFQAESQRNGNPIEVNDLILKFGPVENARERGFCELRGDETPEVTINAEAWGRITEAERENLIFHELAHCVMKRQHKDGYDAALGIPFSIMGKYAMDGQTYATHRAYYVRELFSAR